MQSIDRDPGFPPLCSLKKGAVPREVCIWDPFEPFRVKLLAKSLPSATNNANSTHNPGKGFEDSAPCFPFVSGIDWRVQARMRT